MAGSPRTKPALDSRDGLVMEQTGEEEKQESAQGYVSERDAESGRNAGGALSRLGRRLKSVHAPSDADLAYAETRLIPRHYVLQRPRALQYTYRGERIAYGDDAAPMSHQVSHNSADVQYTAEGISKARERLDLFIDLVWVGIISNLSEVFSVAYFEQRKSSGTAFLTFILVFLPAWRIWNFLREFLNSFYMDDVLQRLFVFWVLVLSIFFGNNIAYFPEDPQRVKTILITLYLFIRASFVVIQMVYSFWIRWLWKAVLVGLIVALPATGLWVATIQLQGVNAIGPAVAACAWEYLVPLIVDSRLGDRLTPGEYQREIDPAHLRTRMGSFLIITIGEGVLTLIRGGPLGIGITPVASIAVWALLIYFVLAYLYFTRDNGVKYVPAVRHRGWTQMFWVSWHIPLFASYISLSSGILFFINRYATAPLNQTHEEAGPHLSEEEELDLEYRALWVIAASLSVIMLCYTMQALLDKPLDKPGTLLVSNRLGRLAARPIYILVVCLSLLARDMNIYLYMGICGLGMSLTLLWEMVASLERPCRFSEPKGLTVLMKKEFKPRTSKDGQQDGLLHIPV